MEFSGAEITAWVGAFFWPLTRLTGMMLVAPIFSNQQIPRQVKAAFLISITVLVAPMIDSVPAVEPFSFAGLLVIAQQFFIGMMGGFLINMAFSIVVMAGESVAFKMGLGFATMADPQNGMSVPILSQFLLLTASLIFMALGGHLLLLEILVLSFKTLPIGPDSFTIDQLYAVVMWGSQMFAGALLLALPVIVILTLINIALGIMTRAAPQLNIFSVGFPITLLTGLVLVLTVFLPTMIPRVIAFWSEGFSALRQLVGA